MFVENSFKPKILFLTFTEENFKIKSCLHSLFTDDNFKPKIRFLTLVVEYSLKVKNYFLIIIDKRFKFKDYFFLFPN